MAQGKTKLIAVWCWSFAVAALLSTVWAVSTPLGSAPDEPAHVVKAAASVQGQWQGEQLSETYGIREFQVPKYVWDLQNQYVCFILNQAPNAACAIDRITADTEQVNAETSAGLYNPAYYVLVGWPTLLWTGEPALYAMRVASGLLNAGLIASAFVILWSLGGRRLAPVALAAAWTPVMLSLSGAVNPSSVEASSALLFTVSGYALLRSRQSLTAPPLLVLAGTSAALLVSTRAVAPVWLLIIGIVLLLSAGTGVFREMWRTPRFLITLGIVGLATLLSVGWTLQSGVLSGGVPYPGAGTPWYVGMFEMLTRTFEYLPQAAGATGWLDVTPPAVTNYVFGTALIAIPILALASADRVNRRVMIVFAAFVVLVPVVIQGMSVEKGGYIWQGRYLMALLVPFLVLCALLWDRHMASRATKRWNWATWIAIATLVVLEHGAALFGAVKRYVVGNDASLGAMLMRPEWQPAAGLSVTLACIAIALVSLGAALLVLGNIERATASHTPEIVTDPVTTTE